MNPKEIAPEEYIKNIVANSTDLLEVRIKRDATSGLIIYLKASQPFMSQFGYDEKSHGLFKLAGVECFYPRQEQLKNIRGWFTSKDHEHDDYPNLNLLLAKDLVNGVTFNFGSVPISDHHLYEWLEKLKVQVKSIYLNFCKPVNYRVVFSTQTAELESHD